MTVIADSLIKVSTLILFCTVDVFKICTREISYCFSAS